MTQGIEDAVQVRKLVGAEMPGEDVQELLVHRVTAASIQQMKGKITAVLAAVTLVAGVLGVQGYMKVNELKKSLAAVTMTADSLEERLHDVDVAIQRAENMQAAIRDVNEIQHEGYRALLTNYQQTVAGATESAYDALSQVRERNREMDRLIGEANQRRDTVDVLARRVESVSANAQSAASRVASLSEEFSSTLRNTFYSVWTVVIDEGKDWVDVGDGFEGKVTSVRNGNRVDLMIRRKGTHEPLCDPPLNELRIGESRNCTYGTARYRVTLILALKQGGISPWHFRDRAQIQLARIGDTSPFTGDPARVSAVAVPAVGASSPVVATHSRP